MRAGMNHTDQWPLGSLFTGYGGLDMGVMQALGGDCRIMFTSDIEPGPSLVEARHASEWGDPPNLGDITRIDPAGLPGVDALTGGSPCQSMSLAGMRAGMRNGTRSGLWSYQMDVIRALRPPLTVWENVPGALSARASSRCDLTQWERRRRLLNDHGLCACETPGLPGLQTGPGETRRPPIDTWLEHHRHDPHLTDTRCDTCGMRVFQSDPKGRPLAGIRRVDGRHTGPTIRALGRVLGDLANAGYDAIWLCCEAAHVGAPHHRLRLFVTAWPRDPASTRTPVNPRLRRLAGLPPIRPATPAWAWWDAGRDNWTTGQASLLDPDGDLYADAWPRTGVMAAGRVHPLADTTGETGTMMLPTPTLSADGTGDSRLLRANPAKRTIHLGDDIHTYTSMLPTPSSLYDSGKAGGPDHARRREQAGRQLGLTDIISLQYAPGRRA